MYDLSFVRDLECYGWVNELSNTQMFVFWLFFRKCALPQGLATELPRIIQIQECLELVNCTMVSTISTFKFDATKTDTFIHVPDVF